MYLYLSGIYFKLETIKNDNLVYINENYQFEENKHIDCQICFCGLYLYTLIQ